MTTLSRVFPWVAGSAAVLSIGYLIHRCSGGVKKEQRESVQECLQSQEFPSELKAELLSRVRSFFGDEGADKLDSSFVVVVGLGGVGSHCAHMLARSGVGRLRLVDFDQITLSSLNRHALANLKDVGTSKAQALAQRLHEIVPWCGIEAVAEMFTMSRAEYLLAGAPTIVVDAIDDVNTKAELLAYCLKNGIRVVTSMGAGGKADPTRLRIGALNEVIHDPLAQKLRWKLKKHGVQSDQLDQVMSVFSVERPVVDLLPLAEEQRDAPQDFGAVDYLRLRVIPVLGTSPSIFGQALAAFVLCLLAGKPFDPETCERVSKNLKHKLRQMLKNSEMSRFGSEQEAHQVDDDDVEFVVQQVWRSRCAFTRRRFGGTLTLTLQRWDPTQPVSVHNLVLCMPAESQRLVREGQTAFSPEIRAFVEQRLAWAKETYLSSVGAYDEGPKIQPSLSVSPVAKVDRSELIAMWLVGAVFGSVVVKVLGYGK